MSNSSSSSSGGIGFVGLLTIVFITLKLTGYVNWSWLWVLSPIWITALIVLTVVIGAVIFRSNLRGEAVMTTPTNPAAVVEQVDIDAARSWLDQGEPSEQWVASLSALLARHRLLGIEQGRAEMREEALAHVATTRTRNKHGEHCCCVTCELNEAEDGIRAIPTAKETQP